MQAQDTLSFLKDLFFTYYQFTLDNPVYAICLALVVWLFTCILYSLSIYALNRKIRIHLKTIEETQNSLNAAQEQIKLLQQDVIDIEMQVEHEKQQAEALRSQLHELGSQITENIVALAADSSLGQQGLTVREGLSPEQLWQRYNGAVNQICERLQTQVDTISHLEQDNQVGTEKIAEMEQQLQSALLSSDSLKQQVVKLELALQEQTRLVEEQQQSAEQRILESEAKYQADINRLTNVEKQFADLQIKFQNQAVKAQPVESIKPIEIKAALETTSIPSNVKVEPRQTVQQKEPQIALESQPILELKGTENVAEHTENQGFGSRFKSLLGNAKHKIDKLDEKLGQRTPLPQDIDDAELGLDKPEETLTEQPETVSLVDPLVVVEKNTSGGLGGKFKNMFGSSKSKNVQLESSVEEQATELPVDQAVTSAKPESSGLGGKFKGLLGGGKSKTIPETISVEASQPEPEPVVAEVAAPAENAGQIKSLFGRFKRK
ncbi:hypothetical protein [Methylomonas sp. AM2-LC]|uniref:hypothetical protein n=1 Tax=Methylomonas sp. AM2-LC TaxID=3153301 RepID=UPI003266154B